MTNLLPSTGRRTSFTAKELMQMDIPEPIWAIPGLIPAGLTFLAGKAKVRKSFLALAIGLATANGGMILGSIQLVKAPVLILALEDIPRRLQQRISAILQGAPAPHDLHLFIEWPRIDQNGLKELDDWLTNHPDTKLVIIDTYVRMLPPPKGGNNNLYKSDYKEAALFKAIADKHKIAMILVHHVTKAKDCGDQFDTISGSTGLQAASDTLVVLDGKRNSVVGKLAIAGRDVEQQEIDIRFDKERTEWLITQPNNEPFVSNERKAIIDLLQGNKDPMRTMKIANALGKDENAIRQLLFKLRHEGTLVNAGRGLYTVPQNIINNDNINNIDINDNNDNNNTNG